MSAMRKMTAALVALGLIQTSAAWATSTAALPPAKTENGITYLSGEAEAMKAAAQHYNLMLTFAEKKSKAYLADVKVTIQDMKGHTVLSTRSQGPVFLANLPAGKYTIKAEEKGHTLTKPVHITGKHLQREVFYWPEKVAG
jgi:hypothetical protein